MIKMENMWHDVLKEAPTSLGEGVIVLCKNKNKEDGIWLWDFIPCWEGKWEPRNNWEDPVKWTYLRDFLPSEQHTCDGCTNVKGCVTCKDGDQWEGQPMCEDLEEEIKRYSREVLLLPITGERWNTLEITEGNWIDLAHHFADWKKPRTLKETEKKHLLAIFDYLRYKGLGGEADFLESFFI